MNEMRNAYVIIAIGLLLNAVLVTSQTQEPDYLYIANERVTLNAGDSYGRQIMLNDSYPIENYDLGTNVYIVSFDGNLTLTLAHFPSGTYAGMEQEVNRYRRTISLNPVEYPIAYKRAMNTSIENEEPFSVSMHDFGLLGLDKKPMEDRDKAWNPFFFNISVSGTGEVTLEYRIIGTHYPTPDKVDTPFQIFSIAVAFVIAATSMRYNRKRNRNCS
ncbi:MAG: hypothetical protein D6732_02105 [Methanobacteriota archaeon]|nr:MAG: hypothetical protein D6732_02105 [Euryarchaeota archaeon]